MRFANVISHRSLPFSKTSTEGCTIAQNSSTVWIFNKKKVPRPSRQPEGSQEEIRERFVSSMTCVRRIDAHTFVDNKSESVRFWVEPLRNGRIYFEFCVRYKTRLPHALCECVLPRFRMNRNYSVSNSRKLLIFRTLARFVRGNLKADMCYLSMIERFAMWINGVGLDWRDVPKLTLSVLIHQRYIRWYESNKQKRDISNFLETFFNFVRNL